MAEQKKSGCLGCLILAIGVPVLIFLALAMFAPSNPRSAEDDQRAAAERTAYITARKAVLDKLKSPSTADFGEHAVKDEGSAFAVAGYVDAQNSFGAQIRSKYMVKIEKGSWRVLSAIVW